MLAFEDETTITQKPYIRNSMSFEGYQQKIEHNGSRNRFSAYISMLWPDQKLMYYFYDRMNSKNTIDYLERIRKYVIKSRWKRLILIWDHASFHISKMTNDYINAQKDWLTIIYLPKKAPYLNPNERKVNQQIKSCVCANRFYEHIQDQKDAVSYFLHNRFGRWNDDRCYDT
jgi:DDE superfamily endonuclease